MRAKAGEAACDGLLADHLGDVQPPQRRSRLDVRQRLVEDGAIAQRCTFGGAGDDTDVLDHDEPRKLSNELPISWLCLRAALDQPLALQPRKRLVAALVIWLRPPFSPSGSSSLAIG